jgi:hypothetical protein
MDFIIDLPRTMKGHNAIFVVIDCLSKQDHFILTKSIATASEITQLFIKEIYRPHALPKEIISNRDLKFLSAFWTMLFKALGTNYVLVVHITQNPMAKLKGQIEP